MRATSTERAMPTSPYTNGIMPSFGVTVPPGDAVNTTDAQIQGGLQPTFFADGCRFYVEAASVNGLISEILNAVNCAGLEYNPNRLDNLCLALTEMTQLDPDTVAQAICGDATARETLTTCLLQTLTGDDFVAKICGDTSARQDLSACLISGQVGNQLDQGTDGRLYVPAPASQTIDTLTEWRIRVGLGEVYMVNTSFGGTQQPPPGIPSDPTQPVFIVLETGRLGDYNQGKLDTEAVSGSGSTVVATARISLPSSPMFNNTIHLINTERAILRPGLQGVLQFDALQGHGHTAAGPATNFYGLQDNNEGNRSFVGGGEPTGYSMAVLPIGEAGAPDTLSGYETVRVAQETRMKNLGVQAFMRIR